MLTFNFWAADAKTAAAACQREHPKTAQQTISLADDICKNSFTFRGHWEMERTNIPVIFPNSINWEHIQDGDPEWCYAFNRHSFLVVLGKAWQYTGRKKYPAAFARLISHWIDAAPLTPNSKTTTWRSIETGLRCENWLRAITLFRDSGVLDAPLLEKIEKSLHTHATWLIEADTPFQRLSNWGILQNHGLLLLGLALNKPAWCELASGRLTEELGCQLMPDGTHWEQSPLYHCEVLHCCLSSIAAAGRAGYALPQPFLASTHNMAKALCLLLRPDGLLHCQGDSDEVDARDLLAHAALLFRDGHIKAYAASSLYEENWWDFADKVASYAAIAVIPSSGSTALPHSGNYMLWDGIGPDAGQLHFHCGCLGSGHGHAGTLHTNLVYKGESILADSGRYTYVDSPLRRYLKSPAAHNIVRVDGEDFSTPSGPWSYSKIAEPLKGEHMFTPTADYASGAHLGYMHLGILHRRRVLRLSDGLWIIWDAFNTQNNTTPHIYEHYYHFGPDGHVELNDDTRFTYHGQKCSAQIALCGAQTELSLSDAPLSLEYNSITQSDCVCAVHGARGFASLATVIATGPEGKPPALSASIQPVTLLSKGTRLAPWQAQALSIRLSTATYTVILSLSESISEVDLLSSGEHSGYGKLLIFSPATHEGQCLAW